MAEKKFDIKYNFQNPKLQIKIFFISDFQNLKLKAFLQ